VILDHHLVQVLLKAAHVRSIKIVCGQMYVLETLVVSLSVSDVGIFQDSLCLSDTFKQFVTFKVQLIYI